MKWTIVFLLALGAQLITCALVYESFAGCRHLFTDEDQLIENATACTFLVGAVLAFWLCGRQLANRRVFLLVGALGLVGFLDELSFGERLFGLSMPSLLGVKLDGVHDLVSVPLSLLRRLVRTAPNLSIHLLLAMGASLVVVVFWRRKRLLEWGRRLRHPPQLALSIFVILILVAILLDEHIIRVKGLVYVEELLELNAALSLTLVLLCAHSPSSAHARRHRTAECESGTRL